MSNIQKIHSINEKLSKLFDNATSLSIETLCLTSIALSLEELVLNGVEHVEIIEHVNKEESIPFHEVNRELFPEQYDAEGNYIESR